MKKRYRSVPHTGAMWRGLTVDPDEDVAHAMDHLEVIDTPPQTIRTGILDARGNEIVYDVPTHGPIGFIHFPDAEDDDDEE